MGLGAFLLALVGIPIIASTLMAGIYQSYVRETTGIFERWGLESSLDQRQALVDAAANIEIDPNDSGRDDSDLQPNDNHDGDCMTNGEEVALGLDPRNPDTDGDGVDDCIEIDNKTDANDPTDGGIGPVDTTAAPEGTGQLYLDQLTKTVNGQHSVTVAPGDIVSFHIHVDAYVDGGSHSILIEDTLASDLLFIEGRLGEGDTFTSYPTRWEFALHQGSNQIDIYFTAKVLGGDSITNTARAIDQGNSLRQVSDINYLDVIQPGEKNSDQPPIVYFRKEGRLHDTQSWFHYVFANIGDTVDFRLSAQINGTEAKLLDDLPDGIGYLPNSLRLTYNGQPVDLPQSTLQSIFSSGLTLSQGTGQYELTFEVTVAGTAPFAYTNSASLSVGSTKARATSTITTR